MNTGVHFFWTQGSNACWGGCRREPPSLMEVIKIRNRSIHRHWFGCFHSIFINEFDAYLQFHKDIPPSDYTSNILRCGKMSSC